MWKGAPVVHPILMSIFSERWNFTLICFSFEMNQWKISIFSSGSPSGRIAVRCIFNTMSDRIRQHKNDVKSYFYVWGFGASRAHDPRKST